MHKNRLLNAIKVSLLHLCASFTLAAAFAFIVFRLWFPAPLNTLLSIDSLFVLFVGVDMVCGPILTLIFFDPDKSRSSKIIDLTIVVVLQLGAALYGGYIIFNARPVLVAFEGDRFRVVQAQDIFISDPNGNLRSKNFIKISGPSYIAVKLLTPEDPEYLASIRLALEGVHPSFRPERWEPLELKRDQLRSKLLSLSSLGGLNTEEWTVLYSSIEKSGLAPSQVGYLPLVFKDQMNWIQLVRKDNGEPLSIININVWGDL